MLETKFHKNGAKIMKILYVGTFGKHCSDPYRLKGFKQAGIQFSIIDFRKIFKNGGIRNLVNYMNHTFENDNFDLVLMNKAEKFDRENLIKLKKNSGVKKWWLFYGDQRNEIEDYLKNIMTCFDAVLVNSDDDEYKNKLVKGGAKKVIYHHSATDIEIFRKIVTVVEEYDIGFFGGNYNNSFPDSKFRKDVVHRLYSKYYVLIHGTNWGGIGKQLVYGDDYSKQASKARIMLGINSFSNINKYCSNRLFNSMACGFHITHYFKGIESMFENHKHLVWFKTYNELIKLIDYYLNNADKRKKIYLNGRKLLEEQHTYKVRANEIIQHWRKDASF